MPQATELLAPAGDPESGYAALHYGADAIYLGLSQFSARAEAINFSLGDLSEIVAYAHSLQPRRRVFVTVNTVILQAELADVIGLLVAMADREVDAVILQDLGAARIVHQHVPELRMHASTQMAIHNLAGALALRDLGFARVTLARELTLEEIRDIAARCGIETETFIHGALCYSYSGLCLFSSMMRGRSGNRGRCTYPCRDFCGVEANLRPGFAFSMKDLSLGKQVKGLHDAGVASFKIEGRKKSPLYVATTVSYYRRVLDGNLTAKAASEIEAQMKTVFSRPWTDLFIESARHQDVVDRDRVGHRGAPVGTVETVYRPAGKDDMLRFITARPIERHDGLQIDVPGVDKPFGFAVDDLRIREERGRVKTVFEAPAGTPVEVALPPDHPRIPVGAAIYCSSSQAVKRSYPYDRPKPGQFRVRRAMDVEVEIGPELILARGVIPVRNPGEAVITASVALKGTFAPAQDAAKTDAAARTAFEKLGDTRLRLGTFVCRNPDGRFGPISMLNELRRQLAVEVQGQLDRAMDDRIGRIRETTMPSVLEGIVQPGANFRWLIKTDRIANLSLFEKSDWQDVVEAIVDISRDSLPDLETGLAMIAGETGRDRIRLALPEVTRGWEEQELRRRVGYFRERGWTRWQVANLSGWHILNVAPFVAGAGKQVLDLSVDWPVYVLNRQAALAVLALGSSGFTLSPEDTGENMRKLLLEFGDKASVIVYQDTPLFLSASCAYANLAGKCRGKGECPKETLLLKLEGGETVVAIQDECRTVVVNELPFCLADRVVELRQMGARNLRVDFIWQSYMPEEARDLWRRILAGRTPPRGHTANFTRGLM